MTKTTENYIEFALSQADPQLARLIAIVIEKDGIQRPGHVYESDFEALARSIISQQLSVKAAAAIYTKFKLKVGKSITPDRVASLTPEHMRAIGLSQSKARYLHNLSKWFSAHGGKLSNTSLSDEEIIRLLTEISGIGVWTVQMYLIFYLKRLDILPINDLGIQKGIQMLYGLKKIAAPAFVARKALRWRPYRSIACLYLWRAFDLNIHKIFDADRNWMERV